MVAARALELGVRSQLLEGANSTLAVYRLDVDSELLFAGDAGSTADTGRSSRRTGVELSHDYTPVPWLTIDADLAYARARYRDAAMAGQYIPGSVEGVASLALSIDRIGAWSGALQWRYFGPRPLTEDNRVRSKASANVNGRIGYRMSSRLQLTVECFNLTNRRDTAIDYAYQSRLPGEAAQGQFDVHFHPMESRSLRIGLSARF
jgi:outer membrane receptor protein involved in Fe transport